MTQQALFIASATRVRRSSFTSAAWGFPCAALAISLLAPPSNGDKIAAANMEVLPLRGAISLYDKACVRCHGPGGSFYGDDLGKGKTDAQLRKMVWEMCVAQGGLTVSRREVDAMTAYHRAMIQKEPYVEVTSVSATKWSGEATPGTTLQLQSGSKLLPITLTENRWEVVPNDTKAALIIATRNGKSTRLPLELGKFTLHLP